jgi:hypothetical protein
MSRKSIISLAAIGTLALATVFSGAALAHGGGHGGHGGGHGGHGGHMHGHIHWVHYRHFRHFHERIYVRPVTYAVRTVSPGPCTCLTKDYTPDGQVVFKDLCTKEMASAPVDGVADQAQAEQSPSNFAGKTYRDYLKANPQAAPAAPQTKRVPPLEHRAARQRAGRLSLVLPRPRGRNGARPRFRRRPASLRGVFSRAVPSRCAR